MTTTTQAEPPSGKIRHSWRCARRSPILTATRVLDDGRTVEFHKCTGCAGSDLDSALLDMIKPDPPEAA